MTSQTSIESLEHRKPVPRHRLTKTVVASAVALALVAGGGVMARAENPPVSALPAAGQPMALPSFADVAERVSPAVVNVKVTSEIGGSPMVRGFRGMPDNMPVPEFFKRYFGELPQGTPHRVQGQGSGFLVDPDGYIVTNNHVIDGATEVTVVLNDGSSHSAKIVGHDDKTDLALLKIETDRPLAYVELGDSTKARVGDWVLAVGNPFGLGGSVNAGIISARGRDIHSGPYDDYLQIDAAINRGNSGGPLFDTSGRVIGVNTAIYSPTGGNVGIGFAIPAETVSRVVADLRADGHVERGWLGIRIQPVTEDLAAGLGLGAARGVLVADVVPGGPASATDLRAGDVILSANGERIENYKDLPRLVADLKSGSRMRLEVIRDGKPRHLEVEVGAMPDEDRIASASRSDGQSEGNPHLGLYLAPLTPELRMRRGLDAGSEGVFVAQVEPGSPAAEAGIEPGSLISMVGADPVSSPEQIQSAVRRASAEKQRAVIMRVERDGQALFVAVPLSA
ncbi:DegQ family serine endoprotease [Imhoffiella purpurea]|uniref:Probable periplasmic serine endoprotease DegP-like n=1 Tax=Imhoffiella purpurea TaxID=1249627 RepID=W9V7G9_9GAMM|nr:DegQ family serine endoprotease [Imhoffiella purpurea]EXJ15518.1 HtrA protease/chaperone protein [Imhoffiella purpurea]